jgi:hypothetical protein
MAGTTVADDADGRVYRRPDRFAPARAAAARRAMRIVHDNGTDRNPGLPRILGDVVTAQHANDVFEDTPLGGQSQRRTVAQPLEAITRCVTPGVPSSPGSPPRPRSRSSTGSAGSP